MTTGIDHFVMTDSGGLWIWDKHDDVVLRLDERGEVADAIPLDLGLRAGAYYLATIEGSLLVFFDSEGLVLVCDTDTKATVTFDVFGGRGSPFPSE